MKNQNPSEDIVVRFISDSAGNKAVAYQGKQGTKNISQEKVMRELRDAVGAGEFISCKVQTKDNGDIVYRYTLKVDEKKKGSLKVIVNPKYYEAGDPNIVGLEEVAKRGNSIKYWNATKLVTTCFVVTAVSLTLIATAIKETYEFISEISSDNQSDDTQVVEEQPLSYIDMLNQARAERGLPPINQTPEEREALERERKEAHAEYDAENKPLYEQIIEGKGRTC